MEADYNVRISVFVCLAAVLGLLGCADVSERTQIDGQFIHPEYQRPPAVYLPIHSSISNAVAAASEVLTAAGWSVQVASIGYRPSVAREDPYFEQVGPRSFRKPSRTLLVSRVGNDSRTSYEMEFEQYRESTVICEVSKLHDWGEVNPFGPGISRERITYQFKRDILLTIKREAEAKMMAAQG
jgi:hypothetical protein